MKNLIVVVVTLLILSLSTQVSAKEISNEQLVKVEYISEGVEQVKVEKYLLENGNQKYLVYNKKGTDVVEVNLSRNEIYLNGELIKSTKTYNLLARATVYDEQGKVAVYEASFSYYVPIGTTINTAAVIISAFVFGPAGVIASAMSSVLGQPVSGVVDELIYVNKDQYRSYNKMYNPYNGLNQYKHLYRSEIYYLTTANTIYGPYNSAWFF